MKGKHGGKQGTDHGREQGRDHACKEDHRHDHVFKKLVTSVIENRRRKKMPGSGHRIAHGRNGGARPWSPA